MHVAKIESRSSPDSTRTPRRRRGRRRRRAKRQVNAKGLVLPADRLVSIAVFPVGER